MPQDLQYQLGEISSNLKHIMKTLEEDREERKSLSVRIRVLEEFRWKLYGATAAISVACGFLGSLAGLLVKFIAS